MPNSNLRENIEDNSTSIKLSVLMVTYNSSQTINGCIESVLAEIKASPGELIIVDNHSTDDTSALLESYAAQHPEIILQLNKVNRGFAIGNNQALALASGEHFLILNPDTVLETGVLNALLEALESDKNIGIVAPQLQFPDGRIQKTCRRFPRHIDVIYNVFGLSNFFPGSRQFNGWKMGDFDHETARQVDQPAGAALLIRGKLFRELNGFDMNFPMFFNDVDLCKRVKNAGYEIWYLPQFVIQHLGGASVKQARLKMTLSSHVSFFRYFEKHFTRLHQQPMNFIVGILLYLSLIPRLLAVLLFKSGTGKNRDTL